MLLLIMLVMAASIFINLRYILPAQFKKLNAEIKKIKEIEDGR